MLEINSDFVDKNDLFIPKRVLGKLEELVSKVILPKFNNIKILLCDNILLLKPFPQSNHYFELRI